MREKVNKWEMPSCTHARKSTNSPSHCLDALEIEILGRQLPTLGVVFGRSTSALLPVLNTQPTLDTPTDIAALYDLQSLQSMSMKRVTQAELRAAAEIASTTD